MALETSDTVPDTEPLDAEELQGALDDIRQRMNGYKGEDLTPTSTVRLVREILNGGEEAVADRLVELRIPEIAFDQLRALRFDLKHHTNVDIEEPDGKNIDSNDGTKKRGKKKRSKREEGIVRSNGEPVAPGLEMTAVDIMHTIYGNSINPLTRAKRLLDETPHNVVSMITGLVADIRAKVGDTAALDARYREIEAQFGIQKSLLIRWATL